MGWSNSGERQLQIEFNGKWLRDLLKDTVIKKENKKTLQNVRVIRCTIH